jgi:hypothetical protein
MGYSMSLHLKKDAPADVLEAILKDSKFLANNGSIYISQVAKEHGYAVDYDSGLYISFSTISNTESYFIHYFFKQVAEWYGERIINPQDKKPYAFYNYDSEITLLIPEDEFLENRAKYKEFSAENGVVVSDDYVEDLFEKAEEERGTDNNEAADTTNNIQYFSFDYISSKPYEREFSVPNFIVDLVTNENKAYKEIFKTIQTLETEIIKRQHNIR